MKRRRRDEVKWNTIFHTFKRQPKNRSNETKVTKELGIITSKLFIQKSFLPGTLILTHQWPYGLDQCSAFYIAKLLSKTNVHTCKTPFPTSWIWTYNLENSQKKILIYYCFMIFTLPYIRSLWWIFCVVSYKHKNMVLLLKNTLVIENSLSSIFSTGTILVM